MARKRFSDEDILKVLRQIKVDLASGTDVQTACRSAGVSTATYYSWRKQYGRYGYRKVNQRLKVEGWDINHKRVERVIEFDHGGRKDDSFPKSTKNGNSSITKIVLSSVCVPNIPITFGA